MANCPECENELNFNVEETEEGDVVVCDECGTEYEIVGLEPLELTRIEEDYEADDEDIIEDEEEEE